VPSDATLEAATTSSAENGARSARRKRRWVPSFEARMMLPSLLILAAISLAPFFYMIWMSFHNMSLLGGAGITSSWNGGANWSRMFTDPAVGQGWLAMLIYFVATVGLELVLGVGVALLVFELVWGRNLALSFILMPMFIAPVIVGLLGRYLVNSSYGLYAWALRQTGVYGGAIFSHPVPAFVSVVLMDVWEWTPLIALITLAGLVSISPQLLEAATVDGARYRQRLRHVILPSLTGVLVIALLVRSMDALRYFSTIWLSTDGGPGNATKIIPLRLYEVAFRFFHLGYAATIGLVMLAVSILLANAFLRVLRAPKAQS